MTTELHALKNQIARILYSDDQRATVKAVADFLGVYYRNLLSKARDAHSECNARIVSASTLMPPGYTVEELVKFHFNSESKIWYPGPDFIAHMSTRLQQPPLLSPAPPPASTPDLAALLQPIVYRNLGLTYPMAQEVDDTHKDLYTFIANNRGDPRQLAQWIADNIPPAHQPEFVRCWKLATKQVKAKQAEWENASRGTGDERPSVAASPPTSPPNPSPRRDGGGLPLIPVLAVARKRKEEKITDPGILAIGVALDKAERLRESALVARAAAVKDPQLRPEFEAALVAFNKANGEARAAWEAKWQKR